MSKNGGAKAKIKKEQYHMQQQLAVQEDEWVLRNECIKVLAWRCCW
jgi:hypothetical protein